MQSHAAIRYSAECKMTKFGDVNKTNAVGGIPGEGEKERDSRFIRRNASHMK